MASITVRDLMSSGVKVVGPEAELTDVVDLMYRNRIDHVPVVDASGKLVGLVSHTDLMHSHVQDLEGEAPKVSEVMARDLEITHPNDDAGVAGRRILTNRIGCLPVLEGGRLVGVVTRNDFVRYVVQLAART
jgi:CBS domain-containing protein